jgi:hypothetical protein
VPKHPPPLPAVLGSSARHVEARGLEYHVASAGAFEGAGRSVLAESMAGGAKSHVHVTCRFFVFPWRVASLLPPTTTIERASALPVPKPVHPNPPSPASSYPQPRTPFRLLPSPRSLVVPVAVLAAAASSCSPPHPPCSTRSLAEFCTPSMFATSRHRRLAEFRTPSAAKGLSVVRHGCVPCPRHCCSVLLNVSFPSGRCPLFDDCG